MPESRDATADLLLRAAEQAIRYRAGTSQRPQPPLQDFHSLRRAFASPTPEIGADAVAVIDALAECADPGLMTTTGPRFFGWVIGGSHPVGVAADWLTSAWGQNAGNHVASPAAAAAEAVAADWLLDLLDLPRASSVGFVTGATVANFACLAAARSETLRRVGWNVEATGLFGAPPITVLIGDDAHTTVFSALQFLGLGHDRVKRIKTDSQGRILVDAFAQAANELSGPAIAILQAGQINTGDFDDFRELIPLARSAGAWVHIDGAFGLWARLSPSLRPFTDAIGDADSWATDGHKWLQTPYDCGYAIVRDAEAHRRAMTIAASYLPPTSEGERDPSHYVPELSRRARGFATWAIIRHLGRRGISEMIDRHCRVARLMAERLAREPGVAILNDIALNQILARFGADQSPERGDSLTRATIARAQQNGDCFVGGAQWRGRTVMRISVTSWLTTEQEGLAACDALLKAAAEARAADA